MFSPTFTITLIHPTIFVKFCAKILFCFDTVPQPLFFNLTKITRHCLYKTHKIFEKFGGVSQTFSISSLKFLHKPASHYEKSQNMSLVFHPQWEAIDLQFLSSLWVVAEQAICSQLVYEQSQNFVYTHKFAILSTSVY